MTDQCINDREDPVVDAGTWLGSPRQSVPTGASVTALHRACLGTAGWPRVRIAPTVGKAAGRDAAGNEMARSEAAGNAASDDIWTWILANHQFNSRLWDEEDLARRTRVADAEIAANKRAIDRYNQARNDATERVDEFLLTTLGLVDPASVGGDAPVSTVAPGARLQSETAGSMIDRLSILALKVHAMRQQAARTDVDETHRSASRARLARLEQQRDDLAGCLDQLIADCQAGRAYFKVYRQFKMYNDPRFNPQLVAERSTA